jgi:hypothetical protein
MADLVADALTNLADVKESLGIQSGDKSWDNLITRKINFVTQMIKNYCQREFVLAEYTELYKATHDDEVVLRNRPIVIDDEHTFAASWRTTAFDDDVFEDIDPELYFVDNSSGIVELMYNAQGGWDRYQYVYWAGYAILQADLDAGIAGLPNDLVEAANMLTCYFVNNPAGSNIGVQEKQEGQRRVRYFPVPNSFKSVMQQLGIDEVIDAYSNLPLLTDS